MTRRPRCYHLIGLAAVCELCASSTTLEPHHEQPHIPEGTVVVQDWRPGPFLIGSNIRLTFAPDDGS